MKRVICISILCAFVFSLLLAFSIINIRSAIIIFRTIANDGVNENTITTLTDSAYTCIQYATLFFIGALCIIALYALFAIKEFKVFQPYIERHRARKEERAAAKREKSVADKEKRLQALQAEIDELKKE